MTINLDSLNEVMCWIFCPLFLLDCCGCGSNVGRSGDGRGRGTRSSCAHTWLCLHCGGRGTQQRHDFYEFTFDFRRFLQVLYLILMDTSGQCWLGAERGGGDWMDPSHLVPEAGQGRGTPGRQDLWRLQLQLLRRWRRRRRQYWRLGL